MRAVRASARVRIALQFRGDMSKLCELTEEVTFPTTLNVMVRLRDVSTREIKHRRHLTFTLGLRERANHSWRSEIRLNEPY